MKVGIVGSGFVGATAAYAMVMRGVVGEIVLVDKNRARAEAEADDILHAVPFAYTTRVYHGDYSALADSQIVILTAGVNQQPGESRLQLLERNASIFRSIVPEVLDHAPDAILIVATNPVDILTHLTTRLAAERGVTASRIIGSGTTLDTARYRALLAEHLGLDPQNIHGYVVGEHGDSEVLAWSLTTVGTSKLTEFCQRRGSPLGDSVKLQIDERVRKAAYHIISGKGASYYGIGSALAKIVDVILSDQHSILTVSITVPEVAGVRDVTLSLPHLVGSAGVLETFPLLLDLDEQNALNRSAGIIRDTIDSLKI